ncbi:MAG: transposon-transfer assisting family protein [Oscillospiraceae bacterium]|nr:transposon-transfer assisting family protein [Oscillospiraceae bacterium]
MNIFTFEETNLMCIYNADGTRTGLISALEEMQTHLEPGETELAELTVSALRKLHSLSDEEFSQLELYPDFDE